jgi:hypothetical protein
MTDGIPRSHLKRTQTITRVVLTEQTLQHGLPRKCGGCAFRNDLDDRRIDVIEKSAKSPD